MNGNNTIYDRNLIYTNHANNRINERNISRNGIEITKKYGTEFIDQNSKRVTVDFEALEIAGNEGIDIMEYFSLTIVVGIDGILKTAYFKDAC